MKTNGSPKRPATRVVTGVAAAIAVVMGIGCQAAPPTQPPRPAMVVSVGWSSTGEPGAHAPSATPVPTPVPTVDPNVPTFVERQVTTVAGDGTDRVLLDPAGLAVAADGTVFVADHGVPAVLRIGSDGNVVRLAGGILGRNDGIGKDAQLWSAMDIAIAPDGHLAVVDGDRLRRVTQAGEVTTLAPVSTSGNAWTWLQVFGVVFDAAGNLYVSTLHRIDRITPDGTASVVAGGNDPGYADGMGAAAAFDLPRRMALAPDGSIVVADSGNNRIRAISPSGKVTTLAGDGTVGLRDGVAASARFDSPEGVWVAPDGAVLVADSGNHVIREIREGYVRTVAGNGTAGYQEGTGSAARFSWPLDINGGLVADAENRRIRKLQ